jgi:hypothetical protein
MVQMLHVEPDRFLLDSFRLGREIFAAGFRPKHAISIWRGGTPVGLGVDVYFKTQGVFMNHTTIATESYVGIGQQEEVMVKGLEHVIKVICPEDELLILDDVYESGKTIQKIVETLRTRARANAPKKIRVATIHAKPQRYVWHELPHVYLEEIDGDVWIDYPHELADLYDPQDRQDTLIKKKNEKVWELIRTEQPFAVTTETVEGSYRYVGARELLLDAVKLGVNISLDQSYRPDFLIALWPGGVSAGLPVHEVYKYKMKTSGQRHRLDHVSINTTRSHLSYKTNVIGIRYLEQRICRDSNVLIIDTTFRSGRMVNDVIIKLKTALRRNLDLHKVRVASVYWNPDDRSTWTVQPVIRRPHYYVKKLDADTIYPQNVIRLQQPRKELKALAPELAEVLWGDIKD